MNLVFLDTGYVLALELANDQNHRAITDHWCGLTCVSFVVMERLAIATAFTIDRHFEQAGFQVKP